MEKIKRGFWLVYKGNIGTSYFLVYILSFWWQFYSNNIFWTSKVYIIACDKKNVIYMTFFYQYNTIQIEFNLYLIKFDKLYKDEILAIFYYYFFYFDYFLFIVNKKIINQY